MPRSRRCAATPRAALIGTNLRTLQGTDRQQESRQRMKEAIERGESCRVLIRNYRPDGALFWNEAQLQPLRNGEGKITHWIGYSKDAGGRMKSVDRTAPGLPTWQREDRLTGLHSRPYFEELLQRDWQLAQRDSHAIGLVLFDIDDLTLVQRKVREDRRRCVYSPRGAGDQLFVSSRRRPGRSLGRRHVRRRHSG